MQAQSIQPQRTHAEHSALRLEVYLGKRRAVKRPASASLVALLVIGCAAPRQTRTSPRCTLAIRYDVLPRLLGCPESERAATVAHDLRAIQGWGFDTLAVAALLDSDRPGFEQVAASAGLRVADAGGLESTAGLARIDLGPAWSGPPASARQYLLRAYHAEILAGRTSGVLVNRFTQLPEEPKDAGIRAGLTELLARVVRWGPSLSGATVAHRQVVSVADATVTVALLRRGTRSFLLLVNLSEDRFIRGDVDVASLTGPGSFGKAVEFSPDGARPVGATIPASNSRFRVPVQLAPGDAGLLELLDSRALAGEVPGA